MSDEARADRLRSLVEEHFPSVWRFLRRLGVPPDAIEDAAQDVFLIASRRIDAIRFGSEQAFLFATAHRIARTQQRTRTREELDDAVDVESDSPSPEERIDDERARMLAYHLLDGLEPGNRSVFVLYELEEMTMQEIANLMEVPIGTVASRLRRARESVRVQLERRRKNLRGDR